MTHANDPSEYDLGHDLRIITTNRVAPLRNQRRGMLVQPGRVAVVRRRFRILEFLDLGMRD
jgi:hypothetical protein